VIRRRHLGLRAALGGALVLAVVVLGVTSTADDRLLDAATSPTTSASSPPPGNATALASDATPSTTAERIHSGPILVLGDSLTVGADTNGLTTRLKADGWRPEIFADVGRSARGGLLSLQVEVPAGPLPPLALVEFGTNPSATVGTFAGDVDTMVDQLHERGVERIVWVTPVHRDDDRYDAKAKVLFAKAAADPTVVVADWRPVAKAHLWWFRDDGLHYDTNGFTALAQFMADAADANDPS
jgi:hypothetical protein